MKVLIFTQKVDKNDTVLGFFHGWILEFSKRFEKIIVICLEKGEYSLPENVEVYSLGKEKGVSKIGYIFNYYRYLIKISGNYDRVFVHMNQEYVLLGGFFWKITRIPVYMWRNHPIGSFLTNISVFLSTKVFCTSNQSYTARFKKTSIMPAGIDTEFFKPVLNVVRKKYSVCMVGRVAPVKNNDIAIMAIKRLVNEGEAVSLSIVGDYLDRDKDYYEKIKSMIFSNGLNTQVTIHPGVISEKLPEIYSSHEICLNLTDSGSFDKTIVESASCGAIPIVSNTSLKNILPDACITLQDEESIADSIKKMLLPHERIAVSKDLSNFVEFQSLKNMLNKLIKEIE